MGTLSKTILKNYKEKVIFLEDEKVKLLSEKDKIVIEISKLQDKVNDLDEKIIKKRKFLKEKTN